LAADSYEEEKRQEDIEYQERENEEEDHEKENEVEEIDEDNLILDIHVAEAKRDPRNVSYWSNPEVDLIGVPVKKSFGIHGTFRGEIKSFTKPYFKVVYTLIDIRCLQCVEEIDHESIEHDVDVDSAGNERDVGNNDGCL